MQNQIESLTPSTSSAELALNGNYEYSTGSGDYAPTAGEIVESTEKSGRSRKFWATVMGASTLLLTACGPNVSTEPGTDPTSTSAETPSPEVTDSPGEEKPWYEVINTEPTAGDIVLNVDSVNPNDLPQALAQKLTMWVNSGYTEELANQSLDYKSTDFYNMCVDLASQYDKLFKDNLLVSNWESVPNLKAWMDKSATVHANTIYFAAKTSHPDINRGDDIPYMRESQVVDVLSVVNNPDGSITITNTEREVDNADSNRVGEELSNGISASGDVGKVITTYVVENGTYKIANMQFISL